MVAEAFRRYGLGRHLLLVLVLAIGSGVAAHGEVIYPLYELREHEIPDLHDGSLDDWRQVMEPTFRTEDLVSQALDGENLGGNIGEPLGFPDFAAEIFLAWSSARNQILVGIEVWDDVHIENSDRPFFYEDVINFGVDGDASGARTVPNIPDIHGIQAQAYYFRTDRGERQVRSSRPGFFTMVRDLTDFDMQLGGATFEEADHTRHVIQLAVTPFDHIPSTDDDAALVGLIPSHLQPGGLVRLAVSFIDVDVAGAQHYDGWYTTPLLSYGLRSMAHSSTWPKFQLIGADERPTPVPQRSWGQIKAEELREHPLPPDTDGISTDP